MSHNNNNENGSANGSSNNSSNNKSANGNGNRAKKNKGNENGGRPVQQTSSPAQPQVQQQQQQQQQQNRPPPVTSAAKTKNNRSAKSRRSSGCRKWLFFVLFLAIVVGFFYYVDQPTHWVFDPATLQQIAQEGMQRAKSKHANGAATPNEIVEEVIQGVLRVYPNVTRSTGHWFWNNAGGAMGAMTVLHCSFSEYLIIFGTPLGTEGHTGRYFAEDYFTIVYGEQWAALPGTVSREVYKPGEQHFLPRHTAKQYRMPDECWALEYARGNIVSMLFFGFMDGLTSTLDFVTIYETVVESAGNMIPNLLRGKI